MIHQNQLLGIIHIDSLIATNAFSEKDLQILDGVAAQAAQAVDNAYKAKQIERNALAWRDFERLLPPEVVERSCAAASGSSAAASCARHGPVQRHPRVHLVGRAAQPAHIVSVLNDYFELMVDAIHRHRGTRQVHGRRHPRCSARPSARPRRGQRGRLRGDARFSSSSTASTRPREITSRSASASTPARWSPATWARPRAWSTRRSAIT
jgi:hypothetical protein